eukprot:535552_1
MKTQNVQSVSDLDIQADEVVEIDIEMNELVINAQHLQMNGKVFSSLSEIQFVEKMLYGLDDHKHEIDEKQHVQEQHTKNRRLLYSELYTHIKKIDIKNIPNRFIDIFINNCQQKNINTEMIHHLNKFKQDRNVHELTTAMQTIATNNNIEDFGPMGKYFEMYHNIFSKRFLRIEDAQKLFEKRSEKYKEEYFKYLHFSSIMDSIKNQIQYEQTISIKKQLYHLLLLNHADVNFPCHSPHFSSRLSPLAYILIDHFEQISIIKNMVYHGANLLFDEIRQIPRWIAKATLEENYNEYLMLFEYIVNKSDITYDNPLNYIISNENCEFDDKCKKIRSLQIICDKYPNLIVKQSNDGLYPIQLAVNRRDLDSLLCLQRFTPQAKMNKIVYFNRHFVNNIIKWFVEELSQINKLTNTPKIKILLHCFDFKDILKWEYDNIFNKELINDEWRSLSLIDYCNSNKLINILKPLHSLQLFMKQLDDKEKQIMDSALMKNDKINQNVQSQFVSRRSTNINIKNLFCSQQTNDIDYTNDISDNVEETFAIDEVHNDDIEELDVKNEWTDEPSIWIEILYSTLVEIFSTADLYTDLLIMRDLYLTGQQWWTSWMIFLVLAPYLVSYSALTSLIDKTMFEYILQSKSEQANQTQCSIKCRRRCKKTLILFVMTPFCILYLVIIDLAFMMYVLLSTFLLLITFGRKDIRHLIDDYVFKKIFGMNKTEIVGYRRLRTLSQLLFETVPQILLQFRILVAIKLNDDIDYYIDENTIAWSIGFATLHFLLEYTIITL